MPLQKWLRCFRLAAHIRDRSISGFFSLAKQIFIQLFPNRFRYLELVEIRQVNDALAEMVALFRVELRSYKGIASKPNVEDGREEMKEYLLAGFPVFAATVHGEYAGYVVCRIESEVVWVESIFVREEYRRQGIAAALHGKAEEIAASYGNDTVYNYVHPNNHRMNSLNNQIHVPQP